MHTETVSKTHINQCQTPVLNTTAIPHEFHNSKHAAMRLDQYLKGKSKILFSILPHASCLHALCAMRKTLFSPYLGNFS